MSSVELELVAADLMAQLEHLEQTTSVTTMYLFTEVQEGDPSLTEPLVRVLDRVWHILQERVTIAGSLPLGITKSLYPFVNIHDVDNGWEQSISDDWTPVVEDVVKMIMLDP